MKAVILAGGEGTRLRPLTLSIPKPVVPVVDRPFLRHQLDLLSTVGIHDIVFSIAYQPERVHSVFGDGHSFGKRIHYAVEQTPLGTGGAVKNAESQLDDVTVVFNGDVLTDVDLPRVVQEHRDSGAAATLVLTPVPNPAAYGLVETDASGRVLKFVEKPDPSQITTDTINAGIYVLQTATLALMPAGVNHSIERAFFPELLRRGDLVRAHVHRRYWIDIGTPEKYLQVHRDVMDGRFKAAPFGNGPQAMVSPTARIDEGVTIEGPCFIDEGAVVRTGARIGAHSVIGKQCQIEEHAVVEQSIVWANCRIGQEAIVRRSILGRQCHLGRSALVEDGVVLGDKSVVTDFSRL